VKSLGSEDRAKPLDPLSGRAGAQHEERRADPRHPVDEPATVKVLNPLQTAARFDARIVEMSRGGMRLRVPQSLMPGTLVQIRFQTKLALAEVRYCETAGAEYYAGVRFQDVLDTDRPDTA